MSATAVWIMPPGMSTKDFKKNTEEAMKQPRVPSEAERIEELRQKAVEEARCLLHAAGMEGWSEEFVFNREGGQITAKHYTADGHTDAEFILTITAEEAP